VDAQGVVGWQIVWSDAPPVKPGQRVSKKRVLPPLQALGFTLDELREARLAPIVSFKGRQGLPGLGSQDPDSIS
jgi:ribosome maturation factor RimP